MKMEWCCLGMKGCCRSGVERGCILLVAMRSWKTWHIKQGIERKRVYSHEEMIRSLRDGVNTLKFCTIHC